MKKLFTVIALLTLSTLLFAQKAGDKISFTATDFKGNPVTSEIFAKNKLTMVNVPSEVINIIMGTIIVFIAISHVFKALLTRGKGGNN